MNLFEKKKFTSHAGNTLNFKIECDALVYEDIKTLAELIISNIEFDWAYGVPEGGKKLAFALNKRKGVCNDHPPDNGIILIVDDVLTTGRSMEEAKELYKSDTVRGLVVFARGKCPDWITPIFQLNKIFW